MAQALLEQFEGRLATRFVSLVSDENRSLYAGLIGGLQEMRCPV